MDPDEWLTRDWSEEPSAHQVASALVRPGRVVGSVADGQGQPLDARVQLRHRSGTLVAECPKLGGTGAGEPGWFRLREVPAGTYVLIVEAPGCSPGIRSNVRVEPYAVTNVGTLRLTPVTTPSPGVLDRLKKALPGGVRGGAG